MHVVKKSHIFLFVLLLWFPLIDSDSYNSSTTKLKHVERCTFSSLFAFIHVLLIFLCPAFVFFTKIYVHTSSYGDARKKNTRDDLISDATNGIMVKCDLDHIHGLPFSLQCLFSKYVAIPHRIKNYL